MPCASGKNPSALSFIMTSLVLAWGVMCFQTAATAQDRPGFGMRTDANYHYILSNGIPAALPGGARPAVPQSYSFRVPLTPARVARPADVGSNTFFGVALDGVPLESAANAQNLAEAGGGLSEINGIYTYIGIPQALVSKDLSHVGYAADGFPVFVSKSRKFKASYDKNGHYKAGSGNLDRCNGVTVNKKFYIYLLTEEFPSVPLCWSGAPDASFARPAAAAISDAPDDAPPGTSDADAAHRRESLRRRGYQ